MLFSTDLRASQQRLPAAICAPGGVLDGDRNRPYDQTSPVIGSAVAALFA